MEEAAGASRSDGQPTTHSLATTKPDGSDRSDVLVGPGLQIGAIAVHPDGQHAVAAIGAVADPPATDLPDLYTAPHRLAVVRLSDGDVRYLGSTNRRSIHSIWMLDDDTAIFSTTDQPPTVGSGLWTVSLSTGRITPFEAAGDGPSQLSVSSDGSVGYRILVDDSPIFVVHSGTDRTRVAAYADPGHTHPVITADGRGVLYAKTASSFDAEAGRPGPEVIIRYDFDAMEPIDLDFPAGDTRG